MKLQANKTRRLFEDKTGLVLWSIIVILFVVLAISSDVFLSTRNFQSMALQIAPLGLLSLGMMFALVSGGINLGLVATGNLSCIIMAIIYKNKIFMVGSNNLASEYCGISVKHTLLWTYFMSGLLAGFGCFLMTMQFDAVNVGQGDSFILKTVLICVLGGVSPVGGYGRVYGVVLALTILQLVSSGLNILGLVSYVQTSLWGIVVLAVVAVQRYNDYRSQRKLAQRQST